MRILRFVNNSGFSLVEVLVVMVIILIITSIGMYLYQDIVESVKGKVCEHNREKANGLYSLYLQAKDMEHTKALFEQFIVDYQGKLCPCSGDIIYSKGLLKCTVHFKGDSSKDESDVPFL